MKKIALLCMLTLVGAGQLYGMEPEKTITFGEEWKTIPNEVKALIMVELSKAGNNLDEAIKNIIKVSRINKELNAMINLTLDPNDHKKFIVLVHLLADKFDTTTEKVAEKFDTPVAKNYLRLGRGLFMESDYMSWFINKQGVDVNFSGHYKISPKGDYEGSVLKYAIRESDVEAVKILLEHGAKVTEEELRQAENETDRLYKMSIDPDLGSFVGADQWVRLEKEKQQAIHKLLIEAKSKQDDAQLGLEK